MRERHPATLHAEEDDIRKPLVPLDDFDRDPAQDSLHIVGFHNQRLFVNRHTTCLPIEKTAKPHGGVAV